MEEELQLVVNTFVLTLACLEVCLTQTRSRAVGQTQVPTDQGQLYSDTQSEIFLDRLLGSTRRH